jgi:type IV secretory pathway TraG/TraD family ATPase VirD4
VRLPRALETQHIAVTGKSGAGKSNLIRGVLRQIAVRQEVGVVLDPDREYLSEFYRPERGDVVLNPLDQRCPRWTPWLELRPGYVEPDAEAQAESLFPDPLRQADVGSTPFFRRSSRMLYLSLLKITAPREPAALLELLNLPRAELKQRLRGTPAEALIDPGAHEQGAGIVATVANAVNPFRSPPTSAAAEWSAREGAE